MFYILKQVLFYSVVLGESYKVPEIFRGSRELHLTFHQHESKHENNWIFIFGWTVPLMSVLLTKRKKRAHPRHEACSPSCLPFILWWSWMWKPSWVIVCKEQGKKKLLLNLVLHKIINMSTRTIYSREVTHTYIASDDWHISLVPLLLYVSAAQCCNIMELLLITCRHRLLTSLHPVAQSLSLFGDKWIHSCCL